jgi:hypothetical protein
MKNGWKKELLGEILQLEYGKPLDDSDRKPNGRFPVSGANGEKDRSDKFYHEKLSIELPCAGPIHSDCDSSTFLVTDTNDFVHFREKNLSIPNLSCGGSLQNGIDGGAYLSIVEH